ncbi:hypothetical protein KGY79_13370 [Candidatus Bipolaricaulota bacterium]|nr:hypothetical protein [Candidatus Bipolaricaulota bacterium]
MNIHPAPTEWKKHHAFTALLSIPGRIGTFLSGKKIFPFTLIYLFISFELAFRDLVLALNQYTKLVRRSDLLEIFFFLKYRKLLSVGEV